jgi:hypothetical protein
VTVGLPEIAALPPEERQQLLRSLLQRWGSRGELGPLSYGQQAIWFLHHVDPGNPAYNVGLAFTVRSELDQAALEAAIAALERRHAILRTTYRAYGGLPVRYAHEENRIRLDLLDASSVDRPDFDEMLSQETIRPFDLTGDPVLRVTLYQRPGGERVLLLVAHHIAVDGWSLYLCLEELGALYTAHRQGVPADLPEPEAEYSAYVAWQAELLRSSRGAELSDYWRGQLSGHLPPLGLATDRPRPKVQTSHGARYAFGIDAELTAGLNRLAEEQDTTLFTVLLAGLHVLLYRYTGQPDVRVASVVAHREQARFSRVVGYFADSVVLRANLSGEPEFRTVLSRVADTALDALEHQDMPFAALVEMLQLERDPSRTPLCDVGFVLQKSQRFAFARDTASGVSPFGLRSPGESGLALELGELRLQSYPVEHRAARYDLELQALAADQTLSAVLTYNTDLFYPDTVKRMADNFTTLLRSAVAAPDTPVTQLRILSVGERGLLLRWGQVTA